jgi:hypothetical protein
MTQRKNLYPGHGHVIPINYLYAKYGKELTIGEVIDPTIYGHNLCEFFKTNIVSILSIAF